MLRLASRCEPRQGSVLLQITRSSAVQAFCPAVVAAAEMVQVRQIDFLVLIRRIVVALIATRQHTSDPANVVHGIAGARIE